MLSQYIKVVRFYVKTYVEPIMLIEVNKTGEQHYLSDRQAERVAKILYNEARKSFP
jgi:hypothetical protein